MKASRLRPLMNLWPPFLFAGIHVMEISEDFRRVRVQLRLRWYNRNWVGTHFGGSLFAMTDPWWVLMVMRNIGNGHLIWDKAGEIEFVKPGRGIVSGEFVLDPSVLDEIRIATETGQKYLRWFDMEIRDSEGDLVARVRKQLYARRKRDKTAAPALVAEPEV